MNFNILLVLVLVRALENSFCDVVNFWFHWQVNRWERLVQECNTVVLLFTDKDWIPFTLDLYADMIRPGGMSQKCVAFWYWSSRNNSVGVLPYYMPEVNPFYVDHQDREFSLHHEWGTKVYFQKINQRVPIARCILKNLLELFEGMNRSVGLALFDSDIVLHRNVLPRLERENATLVIQREMPCIGKKSKCVNGGFWRVAGNAEGYQILFLVQFFMEELNIPDQDAFDIVLSTQRANRTVVYLDPLKYANGWTYKNNASWTRGQSHIVHVNWARDLREKGEMLVKLRNDRDTMVSAQYKIKKN